MAGGGDVVGTVNLVANLPDWLGSAGGLWITAPSEKVGKVGSQAFVDAQTLLHQLQSPTRPG
jgi:hypothetical protein